MATESNQLPFKAAPSVGSDAVDAEHGVQLGLLEAAASALKRGSEEAIPLVEQLYSYTQTHFMSEQLLMRLSAQSNYQGHQLEHEILLQHLDEICSLAETGERDKALRMIGDHEAQLLDHIQRWDRSIREHPQQVMD